MVVEVLEPAAAEAGWDLTGDHHGALIARRLLEIGFVPGERVEVIGEVRPGADPLAVRVGASMFALRRREARGIRLRLDEGTAP